jgi:hypothetical protein
VSGEVAKQVAVQQSDEEIKTARPRLAQLNYR